MSLASMRAASAASKAVRGLRPVIPGVFSVFSQATSFTDWVVSADGRSTDNNSPTQGSSSRATIARGTGGGVWQCEFLMTNIGSGDPLVGISKAGQDGSCGFDVNGLNPDSAFQLVTANGSVYHNANGVGSFPAVTAADVIGMVLDCSNPANYLLYLYKNNAAPVLFISTTSSAPGSVPTANPDLTGDYYPSAGATNALGASNVIINSGQEAFARFVSGAVPWGT